MQKTGRIRTFTRLSKVLDVNSGHETIGGAYEPNARSNAVSHKNTAVQHGAIAPSKRSIYRFRIVFSAFISLLLGTVSQVVAEPLKTIEVAEGVHVYQGVHGLMTAENRGRIANIGFVVGESAVAVVDTGGSPEQGRALLEAIRAVTKLPVRWVINTHMHPDHVFGNAAYMGPDVAFVGHQRLNAALEARFEHYVAANRLEMGDALMDGVRRIGADVEVADSLRIDLGGRSLLLRAWPVSHTDNDLTVFDEKTATLFTGDLVFVGHLPSLDGSLRGWQRALDDLARIPARIAIPGHGPVPSPWPEALAPERHYFETLAGDVRKAIDDGRPMSDAVRTAGRSEADRWELFEEFNARNATAAYAELEWE